MFMDGPAVLKLRLGFATIKTYAQTATPPEISRLTEDITTALSKLLEIYQPTDESEPELEWWLIKDMLLNITVAATALAGEDDCTDEQDSKKMAKQIILFCDAILEATAFSPMCCHGDRS